MKYHEGESFNGLAFCVYNGDYIIIVGYQCQSSEMSHTATESNSKVTCCTRWFNNGFCHCFDNFDNFTLPLIKSIVIETSFGIFYYSIRTHEQDWITSDWNVLCDEWKQSHHFKCTGVNAMLAQHFQYFTVEHEPTKLLTAHQINQR